MARTAHATVVQKQERAIALYGEGSSYDEIAEQLGYANRGSAWKAVDRGLRVQRDLRADEYLQLQLDRLESILCAHWWAATEGHNVRAANLLLDVLAEMNQLLGLGHRDKRSGRSMPVKPWGIVLTDEERAGWEAAGSPTHWNR